MHNHVNADNSQDRQAKVSLTNKNRNVGTASQSRFNRALMPT